MKKTDQVHNLSPLPVYCSMVEIKNSHIESHLDSDLCAVVIMN